MNKNTTNISLSQYRYYHNPWLGKKKEDERNENDNSKLLSTIDYIPEAKRLATICQQYYVNKNEQTKNVVDHDRRQEGDKSSSLSSPSSSPPSLGSLYVGPLSALIYLPLRFALHHLTSVNASARASTAADTDARSNLTATSIASATATKTRTTTMTTAPIKILEDVQKELLHCHDVLLQSHTCSIRSNSSTSSGKRRTKERFTLLESEGIGSLVMLHCIQNILLALGHDDRGTRSSHETNGKEEYGGSDVSNQVHKNVDKSLESIHPAGAVADDNENDYAKCILDYYISLENTLSCHECEVLYGRAGYLQSIAYIRQSQTFHYSNGDDDTKIISQPLPSSRLYLSFGKDIVMKVTESILKEGQRISRKYNHALTLMWEWHDKVYLGAAHGIVGILHTLLHFVPEIEELTLQQQSQQGRQDEKQQERQHQKNQTDYLQLIQNTIQELGDEMCFESANLASSYYPDGSGRTTFRNKNKDKLVQFCHGGSGYVLLLIKAYEIFNNEMYLEKAKYIARNVIWPRGLLRKGVGLCHGISGNAYAFLAVYRGVQLANQRVEALGSCEQTEMKSKRAKCNKEDFDDEWCDRTDLSDADEWLHMARCFASFAIEKLPELEHIPDRPYSLHEGLVGLCALLIDLDRPQDSKFPFFEI